MKEFEEKLSIFYGTNLILATIIMDVWICSNDREIDNVVIALERLNDDDLN